MLVTEKELCEILKVDRMFLWSCRQKGLPFIRLGTKIIRYRLADVFAWFNENCYERSDICDEEK